MSPEVARRGLAYRSAAVIMAGRGLPWPCAYGRWLPIWLPRVWLARLMFESQDPMRSPIACPLGGHVPDGHLADLAGVQPQAAPGGDLQAVHGPAVHQQGP